MRVLLLLFLVGCATASFYNELEDAAEEVYQEFMLELDAIESEHPLLKRAEDDVKTELGKSLREALNRILERIKVAVDHGKDASKDFQKEIEKIKQKLKDLNEDIGGKAREFIDKIKEKAKKGLKDFLDKLKGDKKRSIQDPMAAFDLKETFRKLKKALLGKLSKEELKEKVEQLFNKGHEMADAILKIINEKGDKYKDKLLDLVDRYLGKDDSKRSVQELWEKVKDYFKNLKIDLKEKYMKFGEWVKEHVKKGIDKGKSKLDNIKEITKEFIKNGKEASKEVGLEALDFLRPYKEDLGSLWEQAKETLKDILNKKD